MEIILEHISKRFQKHWIFKDINYSFITPNTYALLGPNGCGKSTLLRILAGMQNASQGKIHYIDNNVVKTPINEIYKSLSFTAPGQEIIEELTLREFLSFHFSFKKIMPELNIEKIIELIGLGSNSEKPIADYSSGMKQRVKLAQAIFSDTELLFLDEPCTNLDQKGVEQYKQWIEEYGKNRLVIIASNDIREYYFCTHQIVIEDYK